MKRRDFLKTAALPFILPSFGGRIRDYGWLPPITPSIEPTFLDTFPYLEGTGKGRVVLLYKYLEAILKQPFPAHLQKGPDCVSHAGGLSIDLIQAIRRLLNRNKWIDEVATELLHIGSRQIIGKRKSGGVHISEFIEFIKKYGIIFRKKYQDYDFRSYNYDNCVNLSKNTPEWLLKECKRHPLIKAIKVSTWEEARDAIRNLYPIIIGSDVGFDNAKRDKDGFAKPKGTWYHAWALIAIDDRYKRPGGCLMSSHGDYWVKGSRRHNQPKGSIWVDKEVINTMLSKHGDSYALCKFDGFQPTRYNLWSK